MTMNLFEKLKRKKILKNIESYIQRNLISLALDLAIENNFIDKEIEISRKYIEKYSSLPHINFIDKLENSGYFKTALEMSKIEIPIMNLQNVRRIRNYLKINESRYISKETEFNPNRRFWKEVYENELFDLNKIKKDLCSPSKEFKLFSDY